MTETGTIEQLAAQLMRTGDFDGLVWALSAQVAVITKLETENARLRDFVDVWRIFAEDFDAYAGCGPAEVIIHGELLQMSEELREMEPRS